VEHATEAARQREVFGSRRLPGGNARGACPDSGRACTDGLEELAPTDFPLAVVISLVDHDATSFTWLR
jgi:hypothetical protein